MSIKIWIFGLDARFTANKFSATWAPVKWPTFEKDTETGINIATID